MKSQEPSTSESAYQGNPWSALGAMIVGFFMILVDTTIVSVANPAIKAALDPTTPDLDNVVWVTSAYLLTYAVPLLITGRLGDRFGPRPLYLTGLTVFTLSSLACGLSHTLEMLIVARAVQGLGAAMMAPQTMSVITRTFPATNRGAAMGLWGATAGVASLVGPLAGGFLVDGFGWEWIFFVNVPVGVIAFVLAWKLVPKLPTTDHRLDFVGIILSATALFCIVFGLQEAEAYNWGTIWGPISVWSLIVTGLVLFVIFIVTQARAKTEPLVPISLFRNRNFSISSAVVAVVGFAVTSMTLPMMFFIQTGRGQSPTHAALLTVPMAVFSGVLAPLAGRLLDRVDPRYLLIPGLLLVSGSLVWYSALMNPDTPLWWFLLPSATLGVGSAGMWGPLSTTATRDLPLSLAGAGSGVYNTTRTVGSVLGSASIAAFMQARLVANVPGAEQGSGDLEGNLPAALTAPFSTAMAQSLLLPAAVLLIGIVAVCFLRRPASIAAR